MDKYTERKQASLIIVDKIENNEIYVTKKQFDRDTGEELESITHRFSKSTLMKNKAQIEAQLADINELLKEFEVK